MSEKYRQVQIEMQMHLTIPHGFTRATNIPVWFIVFAQEWQLAQKQDAGT